MCQKLLRLEECKPRATDKEPTLPTTCRRVTSPLQLEFWRGQLAGHPDNDFAEFIVRGIEHGFRIGLDRSRTTLKPRRSNMVSAKEQPQVVQQYLEAEVEAGRVVEIEDSLAACIHTSPFGVIPKKHKPGKWRLILDLSSPEGSSVNDGVSKELSSLSYVTIDDVVAAIQLAERGALLAKMDIKQAYRNIPVHPDDRFCLGMQWEGKVFIDTTLPFGLRSAPLLFTAVADAAQWIMEKRGARPVFHYIDDFITVGRAETSQCQRNVEIMEAVCEESGLPLAPEKSEGPATAIEFLGLLLDTEALEIRLPNNKLDRMRQALETWRGRKACQKRELLSLIGVLSHACKAVRAGRSFLRRLIDLATVVKHLDHYVRLTVSARADMEWWYQFSAAWNGVSMMSTVNKRHPGAHLVSDASGNWGCGAYAGDEWFQLRWTGPIAAAHITIKELVPIVLAAAVWGAQWQGLTVQAECDNAAVVSIINQGTSRNQEVMHLMRCLAFVMAKFQFSMFATHIKGVNNTRADALSRDNWPLFHSLHPQAQRYPTAIPEPLLDLLVVSQPNWTSQHWTQLWSSIFGTE